MIGLTNAGGGGGSGGLFYDVACQAAEPAKKEGRIWVKSSVPMTHFEFSPIWGGAGIGAVAIQGNIGGANPLPTNNVLEVFQTKRKGIPHRMKASPASCMQVQGTAGNWVNVDAYVCHGGTWVQFSCTIVYLYNNGVLNNAFTGGISVVRKGISENNNTRNTPKVTYNTDSIVITNGGSTYNDGGIVHFTNKVNLTMYKTLRFEGSGVGGYNKLYIWPNFGSYINTNSVASIQTTGNLDISALTGEFYIGFGIYGRNDNKVTVRSVYLQ